MRSRMHKNNAAASQPGQDEADAAPRAVFFDDSGRRWRRIRWVCAPLVAILLIVAAVVGVLSISPPHADLSSRPTLSKRDIGTHIPVIGSGPMDRVIAMDRSEPGSVRGTDPFTGEQVGTLTADEVAQVGSSPYALQRYGYSAGAHKTITLTYDDGPNPEVTPQLLDLLGREKVPATFFVVGRYAVQNPDLIRRVVREGHAIGVHTMTHPDIAEEPNWREQAEVVANERVIRDIAGVDASMWRMPYDAANDELKQSTVDGLLRGQRLGYTHVSYTDDTRDWAYLEQDADGNHIPLPDLANAEDNVTILLHDGGGQNRKGVIDYTQRLITLARENGYTFHTIPQVVPATEKANEVVTPTIQDALAYGTARLALDWPATVLSALFVFAIFSVLVTGLGGAALAVFRRRRRNAMTWPQPEEMGVSVSVALAAYNEEKVIGRTLQTILASDYPILEVVVVDDGSKDATAQLARAIGAYDPRVRVVTKPNAGKAAALNTAVALCRGEVVVTLDADTIMTTSTVTNLVRHFAVDEAGRLGGVAGVVKVGNRDTNLLTRWQALEYLTQIGIDRAAQDSLRAITIVPGACAAWGKEAIIDCGGYTSDTLAEDCDLALVMHRRGWRVTQDDEAVSYTEVPETVDDLLTQRTRWTFGTLQAIYKQRDMLLRPRFGALGMFVLPNYVLSILVPLFFLPFIVVMTLLTLQTEGAAMLLAYFAVFVGVYAVVVAVAIRLMHEDWRHLAMVPLYRVMYEPLRAYLLYTSVLSAMKGMRMGWNKLERTGSVHSRPDTVAVPGLLVAHQSASAMEMTS